MDWNASLRRNYAASAYGQYDQPVPSTLADGIDKDLQMQRRRWQTDLATAEQAAMAGLVSREDVDQIRLGNQSNWVQKLLGLSAQENHNSGGFLETMADVLSVDNYGVVALSRGAGSGIAKGEMTYANPLEMVAPIKTANMAVKAMGFEGMPESFQGPAIPIPNPSALPMVVADRVWHQDVSARYGAAIPLAVQVGFSPEAAVQSWRHKDTWGDVIDGATDPSEYHSASWWAKGMAGFVMDVGLSPSTYLTFGMKAGAKVAVSEEAAKILGTTGPGKRMLSKYGTELYKLATHKVLPRLQQEAVEAGEAIGGKLINTTLAERWHSEIADYMVKNWKDLHKEYVAGLTGKGGGDKMARAIAGATVMPSTYGLAGEAVQVSVREALAKRLGTQAAGYSAKDLFQETAGVLTKERGLFTTGTGKLASVIGHTKLAAPVNWALDTFNKGWRNSPEVNEWLRFNEIAKQEEFDRLYHAANEAFSPLTPQERETVTDLIESRHAAQSFGESSLTHVAHTEAEPHIEKAITFFRSKMQEFLENEHKEGIPTQTVQDYVAHIRNPQAQVLAQDLLRRIPDADVSRTASVYAHQRAIATIAEAESIFGKDTFIKDAHEILVRRGRASHQMIQDERLFKQITLQSSFPMAVVHASQRGMSNALINQHVQKASFGVQTIIPYEQVYESEVGRLRELGFDRNARRSAALIKFLARHNDALSPAEREVSRAERLKKNKILYERPKQPGQLAGKMTDEGRKEAEKWGFSEAAVLHAERGSGATKPLPSKLRYRPRDLHVDETRPGEWAGTRAVGTVSTVNAHDAAAMLTDESHEMWRQVFKGGPKDKPSLTRAYGIIHSLNKWTLEHLDAPLPAVFPDFDRVVLQAYEKVKPLTVKKRRQLERTLLSISSDMKAPVSVRKLVPQVPDELIQYAKVMRRANGIWTSDVPPSRAQMRQIHESASKVGLSAAMLKEIKRNLFNKDELESATEADLLHTFLRPFEGGHQTQDVQKILPEYLTKWGSVVPMTIHVAHKVEGNTWRESFDQTLATTTEEAKGGAETGVGTGIKNKVRENEELSALRTRVEKAERAYHAHLDKVKSVTPDEEWVKRGRAIKDYETRIKALKDRNRFLLAANEPRVDVMDARKGLKGDVKYQSEMSVSLMERARKIINDERGYQILLDAVKDAQKAGDDGLEAFMAILKDERLAKLTEDQRSQLRKMANKLAKGPERAANLKQIKTLSEAVTRLKELHPAAPEYVAASQEAKKAYEEMVDAHKAYKAADKTKAKEPLTGGGISPPHEQYTDAATASDKLLRVRKTLAKARSELLTPTMENKKNLEGHIARLEAEEAKLREQVAGKSKQGPFTLDNRVADASMFGKEFDDAWDRTAARREQRKAVQREFASLDGKAGADNIKAAIRKYVTGLPDSEDGNSVADVADAIVDIFPKVWFENLVVHGEHNRARAGGYHARIQSEGPDAASFASNVASIAMSFGDGDLRRFTGTLAHEIGHHLYYMSPEKTQHELLDAWVTSLPANDRYHGFLKEAVQARGTDATIAQWVAHYKDFANKQPEMAYRLFGEWVAESVSNKAHGIVSKQFEGNGVISKYLNKAWERFTHFVDKLSGIDDVHPAIAKFIDDIRDGRIKPKEIPGHPEKFKKTWMTDSAGMPTSKVRDLDSEEFRSLPLPEQDLHAAFDEGTTLAERKDNMRATLKYYADKTSTYSRSRPYAAEYAPYRDAKTAEALIDKVVEDIKANGQYRNGASFSVTNRKELDSVDSYDMPKPDQHGLLRPSTKPVAYKVYVPEGVARALKDLNAPSIDPELSENARRMILVYDQFMNFYKSNIMTPFLSFWNRQLIQNAATTTLATGLKMMDPKDDFRVARNTVKMVRYAMAKYTDAFIHEDGHSEWMKTLGNTVIPGLKMTFKELEHELRISGVYRGMPSMEGLRDITKWGQGLAGASGAGFGASTGGLIGGAAGAVADKVTGNEDNDYQKLGMEAGSTVGLALGAFIGGRKIKNAGMPVKGIDGLTRLVQSRWMPWTRVGEKYTEIPFRVALFMQKLEEHGSIAEARRAVHQHFVDYQGMSVFERRVMRRLVPFYAWTKHAINNSLDMAVEHPERLGVMFKLTHAVNGEQVDPEDVPDRFHEKLTVIGKNGGEKPDNSPYFALTGLGLPIEDVAQMASATDSPRDMLREVSSRMAWPLVSAAEYMSDTDFGTGRSISDPTAKAKSLQGAPWWIKKLVGFKGESELQEATIDKPRVAWLMEQVPWSRFLYVARSVVKAERTGEESFDTQLAARQVLGVGLYKVDPKTEALYENRAKLNAMEALLNHVKIRAKRHTNDGW